MKYVEILIKCPCGEDFLAHIEPKRIPIGYGDYILVYCPACKKSVELTRQSRLRVVCHKGTNQPTIFDSEEEETRGNALLN